jgi:hypothetical protein
MPVAETAMLAEILESQAVGQPSKTETSKQLTLGCEADLQRE